MASARLMPIALTLMRTSFGPGAGTWTSTNSGTAGPPACANLIVRDMVVSVKSGWGCGIWLRPRWWVSRRPASRDGLTGREIRGATLDAAPDDKSPISSKSSGSSRGVRLIHGMSRFGMARQELELRIGYACWRAEQRAKREHNWYAVNAPARAVAPARTEGVPFERGHPAIKQTERHWTAA